VLLRWVFRLRRWARFFWSSLAIVVIMLAVLVTLGRKTLPLLHDYREPIAAQLSQRLGVNIQIGAIEGAWRGFRPRLKIRDLAVTSHSGQPIVSAAFFETQIDLPSLLWDWRLALRKVQFSGLTTAFVQDDQGRWRINGLTLEPPKNRNFALNHPLDLFLFGKRIRLNNSHLSFHFRTGHSTQVVLPSITLENDADFHRLAVAFAVDKDAKALSLVVEATGDPRDEAQFFAKGYLQLERFPMEKVVAATAMAAWQHLDQGRWSDGSRMDLKLWFSGNPHKGLALAGEVTAQDLPLKLPAEWVLPERTQAQLSGHWRPASGWQVDLKQLQLHWPNASSPAMDVSLSGRLGDPLQLAAASIDLGAWHALASSMGMSHPVLDGLAPQGILEQVHLKLTRPEDGYFALRCRLKGLGVNSLKGSPEFRRVDGYLETTGQGGQLDLDSQQGFSMHYPAVYKAPLAYQEARGQLRWSLDAPREQVLVSSSRLSLRGEEGEAEGYLYLALPLKKTPTTEPLMHLAVGLKDAAASLHKKYVPYTLNEKLLGWLDRAIQGGRLIDGGFIYRGSLLKNPLTSRSIQLYLNIDEGQLAFDPRWPVLQHAKARLVLDDNDLRVSLSDGELQGNRLRDVQLQLTREPGLTLDLQGPILGRSEGLMALLQASPVAEITQGSLAQLQLQGDVQGTLAVKIPLAPDGASSQQLDLLLQDNRLNLPGLNLGFESINGSLHYNPQQGLYSPQLTASLWGSPLSASLGLDGPTGQARTQLAFNGSLDVAPLQAWLKRPELLFAQGQSRVQGVLRLPSLAPDGAKDLQLQLTSDLQGISLQAPAPLGKTAETPLAFSADIRIDRQQKQDLYHLAFGQLADLYLRRGSEGLQALSLRLFDSSARPLQNGVMRLDAALPEANLTDWQAFIGGYLGLLSAASASAAPTPGSPSLPLDAQLQLGRAQWGAMTLAPLQLHLQETPSAWQLGFQSPQVQGQLQYQRQAGPHQLHLQALHLPENSRAQADEGKCTPYNTSGPYQLPPSQLLAVDPASLPAMNVTIDTITQGGRPFGQLSFSLEPLPDGARFSQLRGQVYGMQLLGFNAPQARLTWRRQGDQHETEFDGRLRAGNLAEVLVAMDEPASITSLAASFNSSLRWPGAPDQGSMANMLGFIQLDIQKGSFAKGAKAGANPLLKLLGFMNFDTLGRRLRFDFSDLNPQGMAFDQVVGRLDFDSGQLHLAEPLQVSSASTQLRLAGDITVATQQVNATLVATLPVSGNLTLAAALTGALPVAAGVYLAGKLFKKQVEKASSLKYRVRGPWVDPEMSLQAVFDDETQQDLKPTVIKPKPARKPRG
jgi:uncharacterized protein (TIGR02099 family)